MYIMPNNKGTATGLTALVMGPPTQSSHVMAQREHSCTPAHIYTFVSNLSCHSSVTNRLFITPNSFKYSVKTNFEDLLYVYNS